MTLWAIACDTAGALEAECVYSIWSSLELANQEQRRLSAAFTYGGGCYGGQFYVITVEIDRSSDEWLS